MGIIDLDVIVKSLPPGGKRLFDRIFHVGVTEGRLIPPETMHPWIKEHFGSIEVVTNQKIVRVTNLVTLEGALFNRLRARRPMERKERLDIESQLIEGRKNDPLYAPRHNTPEDLFGRVEGDYCITGSNIAKWEGLHGVVIFNEHNPLHFSKEQVIDYIDTGWRWAQEAHKLDPSAKYFLFMWNCLWRAGASILHGHAQVMLGRDMHYAKIEGLRRAALSYKAQYGSNYFDDLYQLHLSLGCAFDKEGTRVLAYLAPLKEKEVILLAPALNQSLKERIYETLACLRDQLEVASFNLALFMPPLAPVDESWEGFPVVVRLVDRGALKSRPSDVGAMELYAASVISSDPFDVARRLKEALA